MCGDIKNCQRKEEMKKIKKCSPIQIKKCHGNVKTHPCTDRITKTRKKQ